MLGFFKIDPLMITTVLLSSRTNNTYSFLIDNDFSLTIHFCWIDCNISIGISSKCVNFPLLNQLAWWFHIILTNKTKKVWECNGTVMGQLGPHWRTNILTINRCTNLLTSCRLHNNTYGNMLFKVEWIFYKGFVFNMLMKRNLMTKHLIWLN